MSRAERVVWPWRHPKANIAPAGLKLCMLHMVRAPADANIARGSRPNSDLRAVEIERSDAAFRGAQPPPAPPPPCTRPRAPRNCPARGRRGARRRRSISRSQSAAVCSRASAASIVASSTYSQKPSVHSRNTSPVANGKRRALDGRDEVLVVAERREQPAALQRLRAPRPGRGSPASTMFWTTLWSLVCATIAPAAEAVEARVADMPPHGRVVHACRSRAPWPSRACRRAVRDCARCCATIARCAAVERGVDRRAGALGRLLERREDHAHRELRRDIAAAVAAGAVAHHAEAAAPARPEAAGVLVALAPAGIGQHGDLELHAYARRLRRVVASRTGRAAGAPSPGTRAGIPRRRGSGNRSRLRARSRRTAPRTGSTASPCGSSAAASRSTRVSVSRSSSFAGSKRASTAASAARMPGHEPFLVRAQALARVDEAAQRRHEALSARHQQMRERGVEARART